ncbi:OprO/OprP family phosphate-selective porin, partial [Kordiimonas lacus]
MRFPTEKKVSACALCGCLTLAAGEAKASEVDFFGQLQLDATDVSPAGAPMLSAGDVLRSLKAGVGVEVSDRLGGQVELAMPSGGNVSLDDSYLHYRVTENTSLSLGHYKVYHTMSAATSERDGGLPERSMVSDAFEVGTGGQLGAFLHSYGDSWSLQTGVSLDDLNEDTEDTDGWGLHVRATYAPILSGTSFLHVGLSVYHRNEKDDMLSLAAQPEAWLDGDDVFTSSLTPADRYRHANIEVAGSRGPWLIQAEYGGLRTKGTETYTYDGGYVAASYVLTGEHRPYDAASGTVAALVPAQPLGHGAGAWEVSVRYSRLDLQDRGQGTYGHTWAASLNWYATESLRLMIGATDFSTDGDTHQRGNTFGMRMQMG